MKKLSTSEIRNKWLSFFQSKGHLIVPSKSLIPVNDPSLLWINSGVATLKDYFIGKTTPECNRLTNSQVAIRTNDIENIGITSRHHTIFEMLGNFSIGDYFKEEAIEFGYEMLTKVLELDVSKLYFTVYDQDAIAYNKWTSLGISPSHIVKGNKNRNFWDIGQGPCGPCTEIFYDRGEKYDANKQGVKLFLEDLENDRYIEIWNIVFSEFNNDGQGNYTELVRKNIDTGAGLERLACILQDAPTNFEIDSYARIINGLELLGKQKYDPNAFFSNDYEQNEINKCYRIIADHIKANVFAISDGAVPSNKERGSVLRRLIRRSMVCARKLNLNKEFIVVAANIIIDEFKDYFPNLKENKAQIIETLEKERKLFESTLESGYKLFETEINGKNKLEGNVVFKLVDTYGFPFELIKELCEQNKVKVDEADFFNRLNQHKEISKANTNNVGMESQMTDLINFTEESEFLYDKTELKNVKIIGMFDKNFNKKWEATGEIWLAFDKTVFYATSGGQIHDNGIIVINNHEFEVLDVIKAPNAQHLHLINLKSHTTNIKDISDLKIDINFRANVSRNHTTEHLLEHVLNKTIDSSIKQEGAFKTDTYFTFDFKYSQKLTPEQIKMVEDKVNDIINSSKSVSTTIKSHEEATQSNTVGHFTEKYKTIKGGLRVVNIDSINDEICGGTHVNNTSDIQKFMIVEYAQKGNGTWRMRAITSNDTINQYLLTEIEKYQIEIERIKKITFEYRISNKELNTLLSEVNYFASIDNLNKIKNMLVIIKGLFDKEASSYMKDQSAKAIADIKTLEKNYSISNKICYLVCHDQDLKNVIAALNEEAKDNNTYLYIALNIFNDKIQYSLVALKNSDTVDASEIIKKINLISNGSGGGNKFYAQGGTNDISSNDKILEIIKNN